METTCGVRDDEAYIPPAREAGHERSWPPASRVIAIEQARRARLQERGLAVDDDTLERVADAVMDPRYRIVGSFYTAEESEDELPDGVYERVEQYLDRHPEIDGGIEIEWRNERLTLFVGIVGDPQAHRAALARIGGERVVLERRPRTVAELRAIEDRIDADTPQLTDAGLRLESVWSKPERGVVEVYVIGGSDESAVAELFAGRYGEAVVVVWLGPRPHREVAHPFASWTSEGHRIRVFFALDHNGQRPGKARVERETDEHIVIALSRLEPVGRKTLIGGFAAHQADVELRAPVGSRAVVDASAGVARPSVEELRSRPERHWPYPAGRGRPPGRAVEPTDMMIEELELTVHAFNVVTASGVEFVEDVAWLSADELAALPNMTQKVFDEIVDALAARGLSLSSTRKR
jgi:hypothetical protein